MLVFRFGTGTRRPVKNLIVCLRTGTLQKTAMNLSNGKAERQCD